jgi:hypothetical protein
VLRASLYVVGNLALGVVAVGLGRMLAERLGAGA